MVIVVFVEAMAEGKEFLALDANNVFSSGADFVLKEFKIEECGKGVCPNPSFDAVAPRSVFFEDFVADFIGFRNKRVRFFVNQTEIHVGNVAGAKGGIPIFFPHDPADFAPACVIEIHFGEKMRILRDVQGVFVGLAEFQ